MSTVLVLDDDPDLRILIRNALESQSIEAVEAESVAQALRIVDEVRLDAAIVDGYLPDGRGLTFIESLRARNRNIEIVFMSSECQDLRTFRQLTRDLTVSLVLCKPFDPLELASELRLLLSTSESLQETSPSPSRNLSLQLEELRRRYREKLPEKLAELQQALELARQDSQKLALAKSLAHRLHGSAGSYGLPELGEAAGRLEAELSLAADDPSRNWSRSLELMGETQSQFHLWQGATTVSLDQKLESNRLLVVDDDLDFLDLVQSLGLKLGIPVTTASSPDEALDLAVRLPLMGAILDVHMGNELAFGLASSLRDIKRNNQIPLAFVSVDHSLETRVAACAAGGTRFFDKPISNETLTALMQQFVYQARERQSRVLLVDDDPDIVRHYSSVLVSAQFSVETLPNSECLLERMESYHPDLLLLDIELPTWSGIDICRALRSSPNWDLLPIVMISSPLDVSRRMRAYQAGASDVLTKPVLEEELIARLSVQLERARLLRDRTDRDPLSGLLLRRAFLDASGRAMATCDRAGTPLAIALIDIDHFKSINDQYGHSVGDQVIAAMGDLLARRFRTEDLRCRWGGEEFLLAFPGQTSEFALLAAERVLREFSILVFETESGESFRATFTAGVAAYPQDGASLLAVIRKADEALYAGKRGGRNQIQAASKA